IFSLDDLDDLNTLIPLDRLKNSCESAIIYHNLRTPTISVNNILLEPNTLDNVDIYMQRKSATGIKFKKHNVTNDNNSLLQEATTNDTVIDLQKLNNKSDTSPVHPTLAKSTEGLSHHITNDDSDTSSIYLSPTETIQEQSHNITEINNDSDTSSILPTPSTSAEEHSRHHIYTDSSSIHPSLEETVQEQRNHNIDLIRSPSSSNHSISDDVIQEPRHEMMGENSLSEQRQHVENHIYPYSTQLPADEERREFDQTPTPEEEEEEELYELDTSDEEFDLGKNIDNNNTTDDFDKDNTESSDSPNDGGNNQDPCISGNSGFPPGYLVDSNLDDDGNHVPTLAIERKRNHSSSGDQQEERSYKRQTLSTTGYEKDKSLQFTDDIDEHLFSQSPPGSQGISQQRQQVQQSSVALQSSSPLPSSASETSQAPLSPLALPSSLELQTSQASPSPSILLASPIPGSPSPSQSSSATESSQTSSRPTTIGASTSINNRKTFIGRTRIRKRGNVINSAPRSPVAIRWNDSDDEFIPDSVNNSDSDEESISDDVNDMDSTRQGRRQLPTTMRPLQKEHSRARPIPYRRRYTTWTNDELDALKEGLGYFKGNKWIAIKNRHAERLRNRTNVDLRDKARNEIERRQKEGLPLEEFQYVC
ncbi:uncharacterized protein BX664DRAFT_335726, partial [Halteromyces radiatus]|uniref:uncharacterized protein n=1 Tax=Halteromyces radiatus TaxID=101107 RepID=UPI00221FB522